MSAKDKARQAIEEPLCYGLVVLSSKINPKVGPEASRLLDAFAAACVAEALADYTAEQLQEEALGWRTPRRVGLCFTSDLFHDKVPDEFLRDVFQTMFDMSQHTFLLLTKRPERFKDWEKWVWPYIEAGDPGHIAKPRWPKNVFLGVSCENQARADERIPLLLETPAAHRWVSLEPLLGPIGLSPFLQGGIWFGKDGHGPTVTLPGLDWLVVGGESGPKARPCDLDWIRDIRDQCTAAGVPCYVKQMGSVWAKDPKQHPFTRPEGKGPDFKGEDEYHWPLGLRVRETPPKGEGE